jgi:hypothetical protein
VRSIISVTSSVNPSKLLIEKQLSEGRGARVSLHNIVELVRMDGDNMGSPWGAPGERGESLTSYGVACGNGDRAAKDNMCVECMNVCVCMRDLYPSRLRGGLYALWVI